jgi:Histidine phosphatase superfamily (branch 1)
MKVLRIVVLHIFFLFLGVLRQVTGFTFKKSISLGENINFSSRGAHTVIFHSKNQEPFLLLKNSADNSKDVSEKSIHPTRRQAIISTLTPAILLLPRRQQVCWGVDEQTIAEVIPKVINANSLCDLPPLDTTNFVRLYICRHGETDNNRLKIIQGARVDAPINDTGMQQATMLGRALSRCETPPDMFFHSPLIRARQTADIAASQFPSGTVPTLQSLASLKEIDFGPIAEGAPVEEMRARMIATYTAWGLGNLDTRMVESGESGREVRSILKVVLLL